MKSRYIPILIVLVSVVIVACAAPINTPVVPTIPTATEEPTEAAPAQLDSSDISNEGETILPACLFANGTWNQIYVYKVKQSFQNGDVLFEVSFIYKEAEIAQGDEICLTYDAAMEAAKQQAQAWKTYYPNTKTMYKEDQQIVEVSLP